MRLCRARADTPTELMQLGQAEAIGVFNSA